MAIDTTSPRTRRAILLGALGGAMAASAAAVGRANPADAANGDFVRVGASYSATSTTQWQCTSTTLIRLPPIDTSRRRPGAA